MPTRLGLDFDNTIVDYNDLFHRVALADRLIPPDLPPGRRGVRRHLRETGQERRWTELQGTVYGARMLEANPFPGVIDFLAWGRDAGIDISIISHRTKWPYRGPRHDLHAAAGGWIAYWLRDASGVLIPKERIFFEETQKAKLRRIGGIEPVCFIDDLPEILLAPGFPKKTTRILFDPDGRHQELGQSLTILATWDEIRLRVEERCFKTA